MTKVNIPLIVIDARMVSRQGHGVARYVSLMTEGIDRVLKNAPVYRCKLLVHHDHARYLKSRLPFEHVICQSDYLSLREQFEIPKILKVLGADLYHSPSLSSLWRYPCPWIQTVHDLNHLIYGSLSQKLYYQTILRRSIHGAKRLLTVSDFSRRELLAWSGRDATIVYNALDPEFSPEKPVSEEILRRHHLVKDKYFVCFSNPKAHKNLRVLLTAYEMYRAQGGTLPLLMSIKGPVAVPGVATVERLETAEMRDLWAQSLCAFFPSTYEGFGLPVIEGVACGSRLCVSEISPHREALGSRTESFLSVKWLGPHDLKAWADAFLEAERAPWSRPTSQDRQWIAETYSVNRLGESMDQIYRDVIAKTW